MPFDYILGSIHHCYGSVFPGAKNIEESKAIDEYYNLMLKSIQTCEFQAMAHIDFPRRYFDNWNVSDTIMDEILNAMIKKDIILEVNTSSIMNASDEPLPRYSIIDRYVQLGGRRVVLGCRQFNIGNLQTFYLDYYKYFRQTKDGGSICPTL